VFGANMPGLLKKIYFGHSKDWDYQSGLYRPIQDSSLNDDFIIIFPHTSKGEEFVSERDLKKIDLFVAEISLPSTGLGIELGFAHLFNIPILCIHRRGTTVRSSIKRLNCEILEYSEIDEVVRVIRRSISQSQPGE